MYMPKAKPDTVYVHRVEAGEWERQNILKPVAELGETVQLLKTASFVVMGVSTAGAVMVAYIIGKKFVGWTEPVVDIVQEGWSDLKTAVDKKWTKAEKKSKLDFFDRHDDF